MSAPSAWPSAVRSGTGSAAPRSSPPARGDVGEELTYACEAAGAPLALLWPSHVEAPQWDLTEGRRFGVNTEYDGAFLHSFNIRSPQYQQRFVDRCRAILASLKPNAADRPAGPFPLHTNRRVR